MNILDVPNYSYFKIIDTDFKCIHKLSHSSYYFSRSDYDLCPISKISGFSARYRNFFGDDRFCTFNDRFKTWKDAYTFFDVELVDENEIKNLEWYKRIHKDDKKCSGYFRLENTKVVEYKK